MESWGRSGGSVGRGGKESFGLISHRKALTNMIRFLHLIDHRHRIVLDRNAALPFGILEQLVRSQAELSGSLAGKNVG